MACVRKHAGHSSAGRRPAGRRGEAPPRLLDTIEAIEAARNTLDVKHWFYRQEYSEKM